MYDYLKGKIEFMTDEYVVLEIQNIGYRVYTSRFTLQDLNPKEELTTLYTKLIVKEDDMRICGFSTRMELDMFELLTSVSGVGTKVGLGILGALDVKHLIQMIANENVSQLTKAPGVGKKTAQRIILELKDKVAKEFGNAFMEMGDVIPVKQPENPLMDDVVYALIALGYTQKEASKAVGKIKAEVLDVESGIKEAFKYLI